MGTQAEPAPPGKSLRTCSPPSPSLSPAPDGKREPGPRGAPRAPHLASVLRAEPGWGAGCRAEQTPHDDSVSRVRGAWDVEAPLRQGLEQTGKQLTY